MPKKCESCRHYRPSDFSSRFDYGFCDSPQILRRREPNYIYVSRNICDREGDGVFVHFEPKEPNAGAVATPDFGIPNSRGIDDRWRSASDYPIDTPLKMEATA